MLKWFINLLTEYDDMAFFNILRNILIIVFIVLLLLTATQSGILTGQTQYDTLVVLLIITALDGFFIYLAISKNVLWPGKVFLPSILLLAITYFVSSANGLHDVAVMGFPVVILLASLLFGRRALIFWALATLACIGFVGYMDMSGYTPESIARTTRIDTITVGVLVAMASAGIIHVLLTRFDDIIAQVRKSAQEQMEVNKELRELQSTLEIRVNERTAEAQARSEELARQSQELKKANTYNLHRATQLQALAEVSRAIASISELDILLPTITRVIGDSFGFYHAGIFLADDAREFAVLSAANSEGGKEMLKRGHKLKIGQAGILGNVVASGSPRIVLDTGTDAAYLKNPDLPDTRSEMALPLRAGKQIIGALDVQSTEPSAFNEEDVEVLTTLADQVSIAIQNARLFDDAIRSAAENQVLLQQYARAQWSSLIKAQRKVGYRYFGKVEDIKERIEPESTPSTVGVPIMVRGQVIGTVSVRAAGGRRFNQDEMDIIRAATERAAIAAENARLLNDSQKRAAKEQTIGQISSKIGASVNLQNILQTAVEELGRTIPGTEVMIRFKKPS